MITNYSKGRQVKLDQYKRTNFGHHKTIQLKSILWRTLMKLSFHQSLMDLLFPMLPILIKAS